MFQMMIENWIANQKKFIKPSLKKKKKKQKKTKNEIPIKIKHKKFVWIVVVDLSCVIHSIKIIQ